MKEVQNDTVHDNDRDDSRWNSLLTILLVPLAIIGIGWGIWNAFSNQSTQNGVNSTGVETGVGGGPGVSATVTSAPTLTITPTVTVSPKPTETIPTSMPGY
jgi:hypothetical protein